MHVRQGIVSSARPAARLERAGLWVLAAFTAASVLGFATFGLHPALLATVPPQAAAFYGTAFRFFAVGQVWLAMGVFALLLVGRAGLRWLPAFGALYGISLGAEMLGTTHGIPFGEYRYSPLLDPMWGGHVPVVIPLSWFYMAVPSYALAMLALPGARRTAARVGLASLVLVAWDLALDPAMSHATPYWVWEGTGPYYGMPWLNLFGWYATGVALMGALAALRADGWIARLPIGWLAAFYLLNVLLPTGMNLAAGLWGAVAATLVALAATAAALHRLAPRPRPRATEGRAAAAPRPVAAGSAGGGG
jgi:uncharacterized membrane protein